MRKTSLIVLAFMITPSSVAGEEFAWSAQLGKSPEQVLAAVGQSDACTSHGYSVAVGSVTERTKIVKDLFDVIEVALPSANVLGIEDPSTSVDEHRRFVADRISFFSCALGSMARVFALAYDGRVFHIELTYDRCETRSELWSELNRSKCRSINSREQSFDRAVYKAIQERDSYGYDERGRPGSWARSLPHTLAFPFDNLEERAFWRMGCEFHGSVELNLLPDGMSYRCLIDVDNADYKRWSSTTMFEFFTPGYIYDEVDKRLISKRMFIDFELESYAIESMQPGLHKMVDSIKSDIRRAMEAQKSSSDKMDDILGTPN